AMVSVSRWAQVFFTQSFAAAGRILAVPNLGDDAFAAGFDACLYISFRRSNPQPPGWKQLILSSFRAVQISSSGLRSVGAFFIAEDFGKCAEYPDRHIHQTLAPAVPTLGPYLLCYTPKLNP